MNYSAILAKIGAMKGKKMSIDQAASSICLYLSDVCQRKFILAAASIDTDINSYITMWKTLSQMDTTNIRIIRRILGSEIDMTNIIWMYRLKRYRRIKGDATYGYLIPIRSRLSVVATQKMAECETPRHLVDEIENSVYAKKIYFNKKITPEQQLTAYIAKCYKAAAKQYPNTMAPVLAYLYQRKSEQNW